MKRRRLSAVLLTSAALALGPVVAGTSAQSIAATGSSVTTTAATASTSTAGSPMMPAGGVFTAGTAWKLDVRSAPLNANSAGMVANVAAQTAKQYGGVAAFNAYQYSASFYTVPAGQPTVDVKWNNCQGKSWTPDGLLGTDGQFSKVPIPTDAVPSAGTDSQLSVYSPSTDQLWEFWVAKKTNGVWSACWGGRIDDVSQSQGFFHDGFGASASGLALSGGTIGIQDVQSGVIDHALALHIPAPGTWQEFSFPAQRSDGYDTSANRVPEGTRLRLDPTLNIDAMSMTPIAKMVAKAAQKYGFIVTDKAGCTAVMAESPAAVIARTGVDPWKALMAGTPDYAIMKNFPWSKLQALPKDYGKPAAPVVNTAATSNTTLTTAPAVTKPLADTAYRVIRNGWGPVEKNRSNGELAAGDGRVLRIAGKEYSKGLGVHAPSEISVPVNGAKLFAAKVGVDSEVAGNGSVTFQIWSGTTKLADSGLLKGGQAARQMIVDVTGRSEIRLVVTDGGNGNGADHADWADAGFSS